MDRCVNKSCELVDKSFIILELVPGGKVKVAGHNRGGRRLEALSVVIWWGLVRALQEARSAGGWCRLAAVVGCFAGVWRTHDTSDESSD